MPHIAPLLVVLSLVPPTEPPALQQTGEVSVAAVPATEQERRQRTPTPTLGTTVVTATLEDDQAFDVPYSVDTVDERLIERRSYRTTPQALRDVPGVMVQETSVGQGSPYIRGFTAFRNLFLIDGVRLNNSVFRDGPNQYWSTVDPLSIEELEVVKGPSSVLYGSDAIGGTVNARTRSPRAWDGPEARLYGRWASAENSRMGRGEFDAPLAGSVGMLLGVSLKDFNDIDAGGDLGTQPNTAYDEWDGDLKVEAILSETTRLVAAHQQVSQDDVPRTHSTNAAESFEGTTVGTDRRRDLDQRRHLTYVQLHGAGWDGVFDRGSVSLSYHRQEETEDRVRSSGARSVQGFDVGTLGFFANGSTDTAIGRLTTGFEVYHDDVDSFSNTSLIQGPVADDSTYDMLGLFVQDEIDATERLSFTLGARFNYVALDANSVQDPVTDLQTRVDDDWSALVGSARARYELTEEVALFGGVSQGFRAPNLSDMTRFDSARTNEFEIPAEGLDPEYTTSYELGVKVESGRTAVQASVWYTDIRDAIQRVPTGNVNGTGEFEITKENIGDGYTAGFELGAAYELSETFEVFGNLSLFDGELDTFPTSAPDIVTEPVSRHMPAMAQLGLGWEHPSEKHWAELVGRWADDADELSTSDENDTQRIPPGGTPGWFVVDLRGGTRLAEGLVLTAALENVFDEEYRVHGSGTNMPGRGVVLGLAASF
jgi:hemoglobin/transferrin/lactoferrin receptor protein